MWLIKPIFAFSALAASGSGIPTRATIIKGEVGAAMLPPNSTFQSRQITQPMGTVSDTR